EQGDGGLVTSCCRHASNEQMAPKSCPRRTMPQQSTARAATRSANRNEDLRLVARAREGDALAFEAIMRQHNRLLFRSARGVVADDAEAQDVVQESYLRAFANLGAYRGDAALGTWLARIVFNTAVDLIRRKGRLVQWG